MFRSLRRGLRETACLRARLGRVSAPLRISLAREQAVSAWAVRLMGAVVLLAASSLQAAEPIKVVVVTMFERSADTGDQPGEFQYWVEREKLTKTYPMPGGTRDLRGNGQGLLAMVTGIGTARATASVMALGMDPRFDLSKAYWVVAGIAGIDPKDASVGSAAWAEWVIDSDLAFEVDGRELPKGTATGVVPLTAGRGLAFQLDAKLVNWAVDLTKGIQLPDTDNLKNARKGFEKFPNAQKPPFVLKGDTMSGGRFWHGEMMNDWANGFMKELTGNKGEFVTTAMEDSGTVEAISRLAKLGKADLKRVLVLRTASNYTTPRAGVSSLDSILPHKPGSYSGYLESLDAAHRVGSVVVHELLKK